MTSSLHCTSLYPPLWLTSPLFSSASSRGCVLLLSTKPFIIHRWIDGLSWSMDGGILVILHIQILHLALVLPLIVLVFMSVYKASF